MPIYEYECKKCGVEFEELQGFDEEPLKVHDGCGGELQKIFLPPTIVFKGSGFYNTDYKVKPKEEQKETPKVVPSSAPGKAKN